MGIRRSSRNNQLPVRVLADGEELTQYGSSTNPAHDDKPFRQKLRERDEGSVSLMIGHCTPTEAALSVGHLAPHRGDGARYTTVGELRGAGFTVTHSPNPRNPGHVSVAAEGDWTAERGSEFAKCFKQVEWLGQEGES